MKIDKNCSLDWSSNVAGNSLKNIFSKNSGFQKFSGPIYEKTNIIFAFHATLARELRTLENFWHDEFINENSELINGE